MLSQPVGELASTVAARGKIKHEAFLIIHPGFDLSAVENEKRFHGCMSDALVTVEERMLQNEREAERCRLLNQSGIQVGTTERGLGLSDGRFQRAKIATARGTTCHPQESSVQVDDRRQRD